MRDLRSVFEKNALQCVQVSGCACPPSWKLKRIFVWQSITHNCPKFQRCWWLGAKKPGSFCGIKWTSPFSDRKCIIFHCCACLREWTHCNWTRQPEVTTYFWAWGPQRFFSNLLILRFHIYIYTRTNRPIPAGRDLLPNTSDFWIGIELDLTESCKIIIATEIRCD